MKTPANVCKIFLCRLFATGLLIGLVAVAGRAWAEPPVATGADEALVTLRTPEFDVQLSKGSQTIATLQPTGAGGFDFAPGDRLSLRRANGFHHLGDLTLRLRASDAEPWRDYDTAAARQPVAALPVADRTLAAADLRPTLPPDCPLKIVRTWALEDNHLVLRFDLTNRSTQPVEISGLDLPMVFNNIITDRSLEQAHAACSFSDPYMGMDGGYLQVTRLTGHGPALVVVPLGSTPFEAYRPLDEPMPRQQTFEGMLAWTVHSKGYAEREWRGARPWNPPTSETLAPGQTRTCGVKFLLAPEIRDIEETLAANGRPVAVGVPGYVLPTDLDAHLFLKYGSEVASVTADPPDALAIRREPPTPGGWETVAVRGQTWGRARLDITYKDGTRQTVHYHVTKPAAQAVADLGHFLTTRQWFDDPTDPFKRSPSVISYDREANRPIAQERRVWIAGLSDEGGAGSWLAAAMKESGQPDPDEVAKLERFIDEVLWGTIQFRDGDRKWGVRKSAFFYEPTQMPGFPYDPAIKWKGWECWDRQSAEDIHRPFNYPHVVAAYWAMYRVARNHPGMVKSHPWQWFLTQATETMNLLLGDDVKRDHPLGFQALGLMEGSVFLRVIEDLQHEGWTEQADQLERGNKKRADHWKTEKYPFGSEMAWDSTGQEEVYAWCRHFGYRDKALVTLDAILGYMPTLPHWGYNGNARRYWDFLYAGKLPRIERQIHHYGSAINAIPVLTEYRDHPDDFYLLRVGYGGTMGALTNIDQEGFASAAFHSFPSTLKWDAYSGDYGSNFFGHATNAATYLVNHPEFGWQAFGGNVRVAGEQIVVEPRDAFRQRVYVAPLGLWLTLDAGTFRSVTLDTRTGVVRVVFDPGTADVATARLRVEQPAALPGVGKYGPPMGTATRNDAWEVPLGKDGASLELTAAAR